MRIISKWLRTAQRIELDALSVSDAKNARKFLGEERDDSDQPKVLKGQNGSLGEPIEGPKETLLVDKIIQLLRDNPKITYDDLMSETGVSRSTIKRAMGNLVADGHVVRVGGKRYGHWEIRGGV